MATPAWCLRRARELGPQTAELIGRLLGERPLDRLRSVLAILRLAHKYAPRRVEAACTRALAFDQLGYVVIKRILQQGLDAIAPVVPRPAEPPARFARPWTDFFVREA